jgi:hypothetical protein
MLLMERGRSAELGSPHVDRQRIEGPELFQTPMVAGLIQALRRNISDRHHYALASPLSIHSRFNSQSWISFWRKCYPIFTRNSQPADRRTRISSTEFEAWTHHMPFPFQQLLKKATPYHTMPKTRCWLTMRICRKFCALQPSESSMSSNFLQNISILSELE